MSGAERDRVTHAVASGVLSDGRGMLWEAGDVEGEWNRDPVKSELFLLIWPRLHTGKLRFLNQHSVHKVLMRGIKFKGINAAEV